MALGVVSHLYGAVDVDRAAAARRLLRRRLVPVPVDCVVLVLLLLKRRAAATAAARAGRHRTARHGLSSRRFLRATVAPAAERLQFSLGSRSCAAAGGLELDGRLHGSRRTTSVGSFAYAHSKHREQFQREV